MWQVILGSSLIAALVGSFVTLWKTNREIIVTNVTQERQKWRERIREKGLEVHRAVQEGNKKRIRELHFEFALLLNPLDDEDRAILMDLECLFHEPNDETASRIRVRLSLLLKHDWERVKEGCKPIWLRKLACRKSLTPVQVKEPERVRFEDWDRQNLPPTASGSPGKGHGA